MRRSKILLLLVFLPLLLAGCQKPDDDVDFPEPQKPVSELILGEWDNYQETYREPEGEESTITHDFRIYSFDARHLYIKYIPEGTNAGGGFYTLTESKGKHFIEWNDNNNGYIKFEITAISDSTMRWEMNDSLSQLSDAYQGFTIKLAFRERVEHPLKQALDGSNWYPGVSTKITYDQHGNIIRKENYTNEVSFYDFLDDYLYIHWQDENRDSNESYPYTIKDRDGKTYLFIGGEGATYEVVSVAVDKMVWKRTESPTVSYIIEVIKKED